MKRSGFSLLEMLVAMTVGTAVVAIAVTILQALFEVQRTSRDEFRLQQTLERLGEQFRDDAHRAVDLVASEFRLAPDHRVQYQATGDTLLRIERKQGSAARREAYRLARGSILSIALSEDRKIAVLRISSRALPGEPQPRPVRIDALLGLEHRHEAR